MFLATRGLLALVIHDGMRHVMPHFPLYVGAAIVIEIVFAVTARQSPAVRGALACLAAGTAGLATEWGWTDLFGRVPWEPSLLSAIWIATLVAVAGGALGVAMGRVLSQKRAAIPVPVLVVAVLIVVAGLAVPYPRHGQRSTATIRTSFAGAGHTVVAPDGECAKEPAAQRMPATPAAAGNLLPLVPDRPVGTDQEQFEPAVGVAGDRRVAPAGDMASSTRRESRAEV